MKKVFGLIIFATVFCLMCMVSVRADECKKLELFVQEQSARFPDLTITKMDAQKAAALTKFVNQYMQTKFKGDVVIVGTYTFQKMQRVGYAIFDADCMMYGEAVSAADWKAIEPLIFGKES